eukprot:scaffold5156_cov143-Cylindrotheca_fusiformis.AAC.7
MAARHLNVALEGERESMMKKPSFDLIRTGMAALLAMRLISMSSSTVSSPCDTNQCPTTACIHKAIITVQAAFGTSINTRLKSSGPRNIGREEALLWYFTLMQQLARKMSASLDPQRYVLLIGIPYLPISFAVLRGTSLCWL